MCPSFLWSYPKVWHLIEINNDSIFPGWTLVYYYNHDDQCKWRKGAKVLVWNLLVWYGLIACVLFDTLDNFSCDLIAFEWQNFKEQGSGHWKPKFLPPSFLNSSRQKRRICNSIISLSAVAIAFPHLILRWPSSLMMFFTWLGVSTKLMVVAAQLLGTVLDISSIRSSVTVWSEC